VADALRHAGAKVIVDGSHAVTLERRCRLYARRISRYATLESIPAMHRVAEHINPIVRRRTFTRAYRLVQSCLDFIQAGIDDHAARFDADTSLESRIAAVAVLLNLPNPTADDVS